MIDGHRRESWKHTSAVMWIVCQMQRDPHAGALPADHFNPYRVDSGRPGTKVTPENIQALKAWLPKQ